MAAPTQVQKDAAFAAARKMIDATGEGWMVSDDNCRLLSDAVALAVVEADNTPAEEPPPNTGA